MDNQKNIEKTILVDLNCDYSNFSLKVKTKISNTGITAIWGRSGSGKTTLLRCIAGLEKKCYGKLQVENAIWQSENTKLAAHQRNIGYVFQDSELFSHLSVKENIEFGYNRSKEKISQQSVQQVMQLFEIEQLLDLNINKLSGGERQRVAIVRALLSNPKMLLMDEPLASLDSIRKNQILSFLKDLPNILNIPIIYVSHSLDEVAKLADDVIVLNDGKVIQTGGVDQIINNRKLWNKEELQKSICDESFTLLFAEVVEIDDDYHLAKIKIDHQRFYIADNQFKVEQKIRLKVEAKDISITLTLPENSSILNIVACKITDIICIPETGQSRVFLQFNNTQLEALISDYSKNKLNLQIEQPVFAQIKAVSLVV